jgi:hypothetical protein
MPRVPFLTYRKYANVRALREATALANRLMAMHQDGVLQFAKAMPPEPSSPAKATMHCAVHGFNLFVVAMDLLSRGRFDVGGYLYRPLRDQHGLVLDVYNDEGRAEKLLSDEEFKAGDARANFVRKLKSENPETEASMDKALRSDDSWYQALSHTGGLHFAKGFQPGRGRQRQLSFAGASDPRQAVSMSRGFIWDEATLLLALAIAWNPPLADWSSTVRALMVDTTVWLAATRDI